MTPGRPSTADEVLAGTDLSGRVAVVTGASAGLGAEVARAMRAHGAEVVGAVRDTASAPHATRAVRLDLASLESVRAAAKEITATVPRIDLLFNNAGVMAAPQARTAEGFDRQLGTNHLGHFLLTALLAGSLAPDGRIVNTSSLGHMLTGMRWDDPHFRSTPYDKWQAYGQSKTANILFTVGLADRGFTAYAVHPGSVATDLGRHLEGEEAAVVAERSRSESKTVEQGASTLAWAAIADGLPSGSYLADCAIADAAEHAIAPDEVRRLWAWSEDEVGERFPG
jgi:NAD(P)-dependent dehydrogenase (short-subunit alcohol dehydrogenase family)